MRNVIKVEGLLTQCGDGFVTLGYHHPDISYDDVTYQKWLDAKIISMRESVKKYIERGSSDCSCLFLKDVSTEVCVDIGNFAALRFTVVPFRTEGRF